VLAATRVFELDGDRSTRRRNSLFAPPHTKRTANAKQAGTTIIAVEGTPGKAYESRGWELWAPLAPLYQAGEYAAVADRIRSPLSQPNPQYPMLFFNLACCESLSGRTADALRSRPARHRDVREFRASQRLTPTSIRSATNPRSQLMND
jgi:hypothetical protein